MPKKEKAETVDCIASGYEWVCPKCDELNSVPAWDSERHECKSCAQKVILDYPLCRSR